MAIYRRIKKADEQGKLNWTYKACHIGGGKSRPEEANDPPYFLRQRTSQGKRIWTKLNAETLKDALKEQVDEPAIIDQNRVTIRAAVDAYMGQKTATNSAEGTRKCYRFALETFLEVARTVGRVSYLDEITPQTIRNYVEAMATKEHGRGAGYSNNTMRHRLVILNMMLKKNCINVRLPKDDAPKLQKKVPVCYTVEDMRALFAAMTPDELDKFRFFQRSGCRFREVGYAQYMDIDFGARKYHVRSKPGFRPKTGERVVMLDKRLVEMIQQRKTAASAKPGDWIFPNKHGGADQSLLPELKAVAFRAGLSCGTCRMRRTIGPFEKRRTIIVSCSDEPGCFKFKLKTFRSTCATLWLENGRMTLPTVMVQMGHTSLLTTQKYLLPESEEVMRQKADATFED